MNWTSKPNPWSQDSIVVYEEDGEYKWGRGSYEKDKAGYGLRAIDGEPVGDRRVVAEASMSPDIPRLVATVVEGIKAQGQPDYEVSPLSISVEGASKVAEALREAGLVREVIGMNVSRMTDKTLVEWTLNRGTEFKVRAMVARDGSVTVSL